MTLPDEYQIDELTIRRLEREVGAALPEGAIEALYEFEHEHPKFAGAVRRQGDGSRDFTWMRAMLFAQLGPLKYVEYWRDRIAGEMRELTRSINKRRDPSV